MSLEAALLALALGISLLLRPWRLLTGGSGLLTPLLGSLTLLPWLWALPHMPSMPLQLQLSGGCLVLLMLGWPLAVWVYAAAGLLSALIAPTAWEVLAAQAFWVGVLPGTFALLLGALLRRVAGPHPFIFILGRGFLGTVLCTFAAASLSQWAGQEIGHTAPGLGLVGRWLLAWGDGFMTGMLTAIFVAFKPQWLATWSDGLYLRKG